MSARRPAKTLGALPPIPRTRRAAGRQANPPACQPARSVFLRGAVKGALRRAR